ncbi:MAG TPA: hypothetical protein VIH89_16370 [Candidatus Sulfotelmatobacter sp.]
MMRPGRPQKTDSLARLPRAEELNSDITLFIDTVMSKLYRYREMPTTNDIQDSMKQRLIHECERLQGIQKEKTELAAAYNRFLDLTDEQARREVRMKRIVAVLGKTEYYNLVQTEPVNEPDAPNGPLTSQMIMEPDLLRENLALWEAMKEYLHYVPEARIAEIEEFLCYPFGVGMEGANRQAIESALKRHPETFKTRKKGREKFISLKEKARE